MQETESPLKRAAQIYGVVAGALLVAGCVAALIGHYRLTLSVATLEYLGAALLATFTSLTQGRNRNAWNAMSEEDRDEVFAEQMWLFGIAALLGATGAFFQFVL
jgi:hypothetical protein